MLWGADPAACDVRACSAAMQIGRSEIGRPDPTLPIASCGRMRHASEPHVHVHVHVLLRTDTTTNNDTHQQARMQDRASMGQSLPT